MSTEEMHEKALREMPERVGKVEEMVDGLRNWMTKLDTKLDNLLEKQANSGKANLGTFASGIMAAAVLYGLAVKPLEQVQNRLAKDIDVIMFRNDKQDESLTKLSSTQMQRGDYIEALQSEMREMKTNGTPYAERKITNLEDTVKDLKSRLEMVYDRGAPITDGRLRELELQMRQLTSDKRLQ